MYRNSDSKTYRRIASRVIGRSLVSGEVVHHIDGNSENNDPRNLRVCKDRSEHIAIHKGLRAEARERARMEREANPPIGIAVLEPAVRFDPVSPSSECKPCKEAPVDDGVLIATIPKGYREELRVTSKEHKGQLLVDVRVWTLPPSHGGYAKPTQKGLCLRPEVWQELWAVLHEDAGAKDTLWN
jgi:hypothetical protein